MRRSFVLLELILAFAIGSLILGNYFWLWQVNRQRGAIERKLSKAIQRSELQTTLSEILSQALFQTPANGDLYFRGKNFEQQLSFTYRPFPQQVKHLGPIAQGNLWLDEKGTLKFSSTSLFQNSGANCLTRSLATNVESLNFEFIEKKSTKMRLDLANRGKIRTSNHWPMQSEFPAMLKVTIEFRKGDIWEIPHIFEIAN